MKPRVVVGLGNRDVLYLRVVFRVTRLWYNLIECECNINSTFEHRIENGFKSFLMNILDHRILIPKSPQTVWEHLSDLSKNQTWQVNYASLSFLTSRHTGTGTRWRYTTQDGHEYVAEITAWYDGLGYEYTFVDGAAFRENKGRVRLQEIPEGTIVQWTFSYDMGGFLGGVRNALTFKRQLEGIMVDSLKMLWRVLNQASDEGSRESKAILRAGLDYEARVQYKPRHPSVRSEPASAPGIVEPPISDEDTRPRAPVKADTPVEPERGVEAETAEPAFLVNLPPQASVDSPPGAELVEIMAVEGDAAAPASETSEHLVVLETPPSAASAVPLSESQEASSELIHPPGVLPEQPVIVEIEPDRKQPRPTQPVAEATGEKAPEPTPASEPEPKTVPVVASSFLDQARMDTSEISVFDVFGLPKPSETQEIRPVVAAEPVSPVTATVQSVTVVRTGSLPVETGRTGLRIRLRRRRVRLRRPG
jgi:uncharacterized membrane protein